jgi:hypothetical protein
MSRHKSKRKHKNKHKAKPKRKSNHKSNSKPKTITSLWSSVAEKANKRKECRFDGDVICCYNMGGKHIELVNVNLSGSKNYTPTTEKELDRSMRLIPIQFDFVGRSCHYFCECNNFDCLNCNCACMDVSSDNNYIDDTKDEDSFDFNGSDNESQ